MTAAPMPDPQNARQNGAQDGAERPDLAHRCEYSDLPVATCAHCAGITTVVTIAEVERIIGRPAPAYRLRPRRLDSRHTQQHWRQPAPRPVACDDSHHRRDRPLCRHCETELQRQIGDIPALVEDLNLAIRRARTFTDHGTQHMLAPAMAPELGPGVTELGDHTNWTPSRTYSQAAADTIRDLATALPRRHPEPSKSAVAGARWLLSHWPDLMHRPDLEQLAHTITTTVTRAHAVIDRPADLTYLGPCPTDTCTFDLWAERHADFIHCRGCQTILNRTDYETSLLDAAAEQYLTVDELVGRITAAGQPVTRRQIRGWIDHDGIPHETRRIPWWDPDGRIHTRVVDVYHLGAIRERAQQAEADREEAERCADLERDAYTSTQVAELLGISLSHLRDLVADKTLTPIRPAAKPLRFARDYVNQLTQPAEREADA